MRNALKQLFSSSCIAAVLLGNVLDAQACTSFVLKAGDKSVVYGRTMEFGPDMKSSVVHIPRNHQFTATTGAKDPTTWTGKYALLGMDVFDTPGLIIDGMNEKGLVGGGLYFPGVAEYPPLSGDKAANEVTPADFLSYLLSNYASVAEVTAALEAGEVTIVGVVLKELGLIPPLHYTLHDKSGASIVIEPIGNKLVVTDNPLGVMTNSPSIDWHLTNLRNYVNLSPVNQDSMNIKDKTINSFGQGSGLLGLPGDPTPPSRFLRAASYVATVDHGKTATEALKVAEHVLNNFDIPVGWIMPGASELQHGGLPDYTQWSVMSDANNGNYYIRDHNMVSFQTVSFADFDADAAEAETIALPDSQVDYPKLAGPASK